MAESKLVSTQTPDSLVKGFHYSMTIEDVFPGFIVVSLQHGLESYRGTMFLEKNPNLTYGVHLSYDEITKNSDVNTSEEVCISPKAPEDTSESKSTSDSSKLSSVCSRFTYNFDDNARRNFLWPLHKDGKKTATAFARHDNKTQLILCAKCQQVVQKGTLKNQPAVRDRQISRKRKAIQSLNENAKRPKLSGGRRKSIRQKAKYATNETGEDAASLNSFTSSATHEMSLSSRSGKNYGNGVIESRSRQSQSRRASPVASIENNSTEMKIKRNKHKRHKRKKKKHMNGAKSPASTASMKSSSHSASSSKLQQVCAVIPDGLNMDYIGSDDSADLVIDEGPDEPAESEADPDQDDAPPAAADNDAPPPDSPAQREPLMLKLMTRKADYCKLTDGREFRVGDVVWAKVSGYPWWPSQIITLYQVYKNDSIVQNKADIRWFGSTSWSPCKCHDIFPYLKNFNEKFNKRRRGAYQKAIKEANLVSRSQMRRDVHDDMSHNSEGTAQIASADTQPKVHEDYCYHVDDDDDDDDDEDVALAIKKKDWSKESSGESLVNSPSSTKIVF